MAIMRFSKSKKALLVITDDGAMYTTPVHGLKLYLDGSFSLPFISLIRMPTNLHPTHFRRSKIWDGKELRDYTDKDIVIPGSISEDGFSRVYKENKEDKLRYEDKLVWEA
jgi:hypothetical protein